MDANTLFGAVPCDETRLVSIHAPVMDAKLRPWRWFSRYSFNPRARDGRELSKSWLILRQYVSIHAPVMDANNLIIPMHYYNSVSIHAPVMDAN